MKNYSLIITVTMSVFMLFASITTNAQVQTQLRAKVPFDFMVGDQKFAAGNYEVKAVGPWADKTLIFRRVDKTVNAAIVRLLPLEKRSARNTSMPQLIFDRYGERYFLRRITNLHEDYGAETRTPKAERLIANSDKQAAREQVVLSVR